MNVEIKFIMLTVTTVFFFKRSMAYQKMFKDYSLFLIVKLLLCACVSVRYFSSNKACSLRMFVEKKCAHDTKIKKCLNISRISSSK